MTKARLVHINDFLCLQIEGEKAGPVYVDFVTGALAHRKKQGIGKNQLVAKAVGIKPHHTLTVVDATAGLGRDAFVLANLGCDVLMCERSPIIHALLRDGIVRAEKEHWFQELSLKLIQADAIDYFSSLSTDNKPDVIYIDPMFPTRTKSALVKKEMRLLRHAVGDDFDAEKLLSIALSTAKKRVVVKRAKLAPILTLQKPDIVFEGKSVRFDVYLLL